MNVYWMGRKEELVKLRDETRKQLDSVLRDPAAVPQEVPV